MKNYEERILERYYIDVNTKRRVRGGFLVDTSQGLYHLFNINGAAKKMPYVNQLCVGLEESGVKYIDTPLYDKDGELVNVDRDEGAFILKKSYMGRECDTRRDSELRSAARELAKLHIHLGDISSKLCLRQTDLEHDKRWDNYIAANLIDKYEKHNKEFNKVRRYIRKKTVKGDFEYLYLKEFDKIYEEAVSVTEKLKNSRYLELYNESVGAMQIAHGDYNYHNILYVGSEIAISNFNKFEINVQVVDLYNFLRKVMEKRGWNVYLGADIIESYDKVRCLTDDECEYIKLRLSYPEKIWKITNNYYNSNKAWISDKNVSKLHTAVEQMHIKADFVAKLFNV